MDNSCEVQDCKILKMSYLSVQRELDKAKQELHECKRNLKVMEANQEDYKQEIDMLKSQENNQKQEYREKVKQLEQKIQDLKSNHYEDKQALETVISNLAKQNEQVNAALDLYKETHPTNFNGDTTTLIEEILSDPPEFFENQELKLKIKELALENDNLSERMQEFSREIENLKESYECKRKELLETNSHLQFLTDENMCIRDELNSLKNEPLNKDSKGNSLFAEVNDRRVYLQNKIDQMKSSYLSLTQEKNQLESTVHHLKLKNLRLLENWNADIAEIDDDNTELKCALESKLKVLENLNEKYIKELSEKPLLISKLSYEEIEFFDVTLKNKNNEIKSLREQLIEKSLECTSIISELTQAKKQKRRWKLEAITKQQELDISSTIKENIVIKAENIERTSLKVEPNLETLSKIEEDISLKEDTSLEIIQTADSINNSRDKKEDGFFIKNEPVESFEGQSRKVKFEEIPPEKIPRRKCTIIYKPPVEL